MKLFWLLIGVVGAILIYLMASGDQGSVMGLSNDDFAQFAYMSVWLVIVAGAVIPRPGQWQTAARSLAIWAVIILTLMNGYVFRYELQDFGSKITGGLIPGSPISGQSASGRDSVTLVKGNDEHFHARVLVNGKNINFMIDTGATTTVLSSEDAMRIGIELSDLSFSIPVSTANGNTMAAQARIGVLQLGNIERENFPCLVSQPGNLNKSLLGMDFVKSLWGFEIRGDRLILTD